MDSKALHPDILALMALLIVYPYTRSKIILPIGISQAFHQEVFKATQIQMVPVNARLQPRKAPADAIPALAYSGGIDSTACLALMPPNTCCVFHERQFDPNERYNKEAAYQACLFLRQLGRQVYTIQSDFDYVRNPKGFAVEMSTTIPALLLADFLGFDSVAIGTTLEYFVDYSQFYKQRTYGVDWEPLFRVVDLQLIQPTAGLSEIVNYKIVLKTPYAEVAESCMCGAVGKPCLKCYKCFRKQIAKSILLGEEISEKLLDEMFKVKGIHGKLEKLPVFFENMITYITAHYRQNHRLMNLLKQKTRGDLRDVSWMDKWYSPHKKYIPAKYLPKIKRAILKHTTAMTAEDKANMACWQRDFSDEKQLAAIKKRHSAFVHAIRKQK